MTSGGGGRSTGHTATKVDGVSTTTIRAPNLHKVEGARRHCRWWRRGTLTSQRVGMGLLTSPHRHGERLLARHSIRAGITPSSAGREGRRRCGGGSSGAVCPPPTGKGGRRCRGGGGVALSAPRREGLYGSGGSAYIAPRWEGCSWRGVGGGRGCSWGGVDSVPGAAMARLLPAVCTCSAVCLCGRPASAMGLMGGSGAGRRGSIRGEGGSRGWLMQGRL